MSRPFTADRPSQPAPAFCHEALFYRGDTEFMAAASSFIREGVAAGERVMVVVSRAKIDALRAQLGADGRGVSFADMAQVGRNPARIIPAWRDFVDKHAGRGRSFRGIGEPVGPDRTPAELVECQRHEALLNLAFAGSSKWRLLCPYDTEALDPEVIAEARRDHPFVSDGGTCAESADYHGLGTAERPFSQPLPEAPPHATGHSFEVGTDLFDLRKLVSEDAAAAGLSTIRVNELVVAVNELTTNSLRHGGGRGTLRTWMDGDDFICQVSDRGHISNSLAGRERPARSRTGGRGLWLVNQLCDLVQLRTSRSGTVVRLHMACR